MTKKKENLPVVPQQERLVLPPPTILGDLSELRLFTCPHCGGVHFRHAGYMEAQSPYTNPDEQNTLKVSTESVPVKLCVKCKHSFIDVRNKIYDVSKFVDVKAWETTEREAQKATGPGGQC